MLENCPLCECDLTDGCCGEAEPYERAGRRYCCQGCALDGECVCGCTRIAVPIGSGSGGEITPLL